MDKNDLIEWLKQYQDTGWLRETISKHQWTVEDCESFKKSYAPFLKMKKAYLKRQGS